MQQIALRAKQASLHGVKSGLRTGLWISRMMIPITLGVAVLKYLGVIALMTEYLTPIFKYIGLTGEGVLVFLTSIFASLYAAIAVIATLDLDLRMVTILSVMGLLCHNLIIETIIQRKAEANPWAMVLLRITAALLAAWLLNLIIPTNYTGQLTLNHISTSANPTSWAQVFMSWGRSMLELLPLMFSLILALNILQQILREFNLIQKITRPLAPLMKIMGLPRETSFLWIVMNSLGLAYGGAVLIAEINNNQIPKQQAKLLNTHIALNHSTLEDTFLFLAIGINIGWLLIPRFLLAITAVWGQKMYYRFSMQRKETAATVLFWKKAPKNF